MTFGSRNDAKSRLESRNRKLTHYGFVQIREPFSREAPETSASPFQIRER
jgi:hypothetical protein